MKVNKEKRSLILSGFFWNTLGSIINALQGVVLLAIITRLSNAYVGGLFSLAYAIGQQYRPLGAFETRVFQVTDTKGQFSFQTYHSARLITCLAMVVAILIQCVGSSGLSGDTLALFLIAGLRLADAYEDVYQGQLQRLGRLDLGARSYCIRVCITTVVFCVVFAGTGNLLLTAIATSAITFVSVLLLNIPISKSVFNVELRFSKQQILKLFSICFPLFISAFLSSYLANASKFAVERVLSMEALTIYSILVMPSMVINLIGGFVFQPMLSTLADTFAEQGWNGFISLIKKGVIGSALVSVPIVIVAGFIGLPILSAIYLVDLSPYLDSLIVLLIAGAFNVICTVLYYGLVTMRCQRAILISYVAAGLLALLVSVPIVSALGVLGAGISYLLTMAFLCLLLCYSLFSNKLN